MKRIAISTSRLLQWTRQTCRSLAVLGQQAASPDFAERDASAVTFQGDKPSSPIWHETLARMVEDARKPLTRGGGKTELSRSACSYQYRSTLRGWSINAAALARCRDRARGRQCNIDANHLLDLVLEQGGLCAYSGIPMELFRPNSHWRVSIERIDNGQGYLQGNCCLIAAEFNSQAHTAAHGAPGSAQWSKQKVQELAHVRKEEVQLQGLQACISVARLRPSPSRTSHKRDFRGPDTDGRLRCTRCGVWKPQDQFSRKTAGTVGFRSQCKQCANDQLLAWLQTMRGHGKWLLLDAYKSFSRGRHRGHFLLDLSDLLDMLWRQGGRCYYSGVQLHCARGPADWVWSIERLDNSLTYTKDNCVLIAREFQTSAVSSVRHCPVVAPKGQPHLGTILASGC
eukprot:s5254_g5.t1